MQASGTPLKVLVVYYSFAGHTRTMAEYIARAAQADLEELHGAGEPSGTGSLHYFWALRHLLLSQKPELAAVGHNASLYDLVILGSPVWLGTFSPAVRSYIRSAPLSGKRVALFCSYRNSPGPAFKHAARMLRQSIVLPDTLGFLDPVAAGPAVVAIRTQRWVHELEIILDSENRTQA